MKTDFTKLLVQFLSDKVRDLPSVGQSWTLLSSPSSSGGLATSGESIQRKRSLYCHKCRWQLHSQEREHMFTGALHTTCVYNPSANIYAILNRSIQGCHKILYITMYNRYIYILRKSNICHGTISKLVNLYQISVGTSVLGHNVSDS